jgi:uncharacterized membrane protein
MGRVFWTILGLVGAVFVHICFVLFAPLELFRAYSSFNKSVTASNTLVVLASDTRRSMLPSLRGPGVAAYCDIDLSMGPVTIAMRPPKTYWSLAVFSQTGRQLYALNERQADAEEIAIDFKRAPSLIEQVAGGGGDDEGVSLIENAAWTVELSDVHAYAVMWIPYADALQVSDGEKALKAGRCGLKAKKV